MQVRRLVVALALAALTACVGLPRHLPTPATWRNAEMPVPAMNYSVRAVVTRNIDATHVVSVTTFTRLHPSSGTRVSERLELWGPRGEFVGHIDKLAGAVAHGLFQGSFETTLPASVPAGTYELRMQLFEDGTPRALRSILLKITQAYARVATF